MRALCGAGVALVATLAMASVAQANFPASVQTTVAPGGNATVGSPPLDGSMTSAAVDVTPVGGNDDFFQSMQVVLSLQPTPGKRLLTCIGLYINVAHGIDESVELQFPETVHPLAVLLLSACLHLAAEIDQARLAPPAPAASGRAAATAALCKSLKMQIGASYTRVGRNYRATIQGKVAKLKQASRVKVSCVRRGKGVRLRVRPTARGKSLRSVVGSRLRIGLYNPLDAGGSAPVKLTFRR